jgi:putative FmdB family regulatory protein
MPLYEYECDACGKRFELIQRFSDPAPEACAKCGHGPVRRLLSSPAIQFKGSGWYITDYAKKGGSSNEKAEKAEKSTGADHAGADTKTGDSAKPEKKTDAAPAATPGSAGSS